MSNISKLTALMALGAMAAPSFPRNREIFEAPYVPMFEGYGDLRGLLDYAPTPPKRRAVAVKDRSKAQAARKARRINRSKP